MRVIFMGTPDYAVPCLDTLVENGYEVVAAVTQPDKPVGRKQSVLHPPELKKRALELGIREILQPEKVRAPEFAQRIRELAPDLIVTIAYGKILPESILDIPPLGCINVHGSLLPKYRGAAPIQWSILNGDPVTGVTTMYMDPGMDTGDMLLKREIPIHENMTYQELYDQLKRLSADVLLDTLKELEKGTLTRTPQKHAEATVVPMMKKDMGRIDWSKSAWEIHNLVRGTNPWPGAFTFYKGDRLKVWRTRMIGVEEACGEESRCGISEGNTVLADPPGKICRILKDNFTVATGSGYLRIEEVQFESCRRMGIHECGHNMDEGEILG